MDSYESVLCVKNEVFVYRIPARTTNRGYRAAEWNLEKPDWSGRLRVVAVNKDLSIKLEDKNSGDLFAQCPIESYPSVAVEQVLDSSRYFVLRIKDPSGRSAFIGIGFADRADSFDLSVAIQDHFKWVKREEQEKHSNSTAFDPGPKLDLGFKEGQTIKLNIATKKEGETAARPRARGVGGSGLLPPPPGGIKLPAPPKASTGNNDLDLLAHPQPSSAPASGSNTTASSQLSGFDLLGDFSASPQPAAAPSSSNDAWGDFATAQSTGASRNQGNSGGWVQFS